jgi:CHAT domain-containing protein/Tfp pilus assembly protein PilF
MSLRAALLSLALGAVAYPQSGDEVFRKASAIYNDNPKEAVSQFTDALRLYRQENKPAGEAQALSGLGNCYKNLRDFPRALDYHRQALAVRRKLGDRTAQARSYSNIGLVYREMADYKRALQALNEAKSFAADGKEAVVQGAIENNLGLVLSDLGDYVQSNDHLRRAIEIHTASGNVASLADPVANLGGNLQLLGRYREALPWYEKSLEMSVRQKNKKNESTDRGNLALCYLGVGETGRALELFDAAIALAHQVGDAIREAKWRKGKASALLRLGQYDTARSEYSAVIKIFEADRNSTEALREALISLGTLDSSLGDYLAAEQSLKRALDAARRAKDAWRANSASISLGELEWRRKQYSAAIRHYQEALSGARATGDQARTASALVQLALAYRDQKQLPQAMERAAEALNVAREAGAGLLEMESLYALGEVERLRGNLTVALEHYASGETKARASAEPELGWRLSYGKGLTLEALKRPPQAIEAYRAAVILIEGVRSQLREERFRAGYIDDKYQVYVALVRLLLSNRQIAEAFHFAERLRAYRYAEIVRRGPDRRRSTEETELRERIRRLQEELERERTAPPEQKRQEALSVFSRDLDEAQRAYENLFSKLRAPDPRLAAFAAPVITTVEEVQAHLGSRTALIEYLVDDSRVHIFVITPARLESTTAAIGSRALIPKVDLLRSLMAKTDSAEWRKPAEDLGIRLISPVIRQGWLDGIDRLYIVPHQILHYVPFAALPYRRGVETRQLVEDYTLAYLPAAGALVGSHLPAKGGPSLLAMAPARARLQHAAGEAEALRSLFPGQVLTGAAASEFTFKQKAGSYTMLHLATHGSFNKLNPLFSALELEPGQGEDGRLEVHEILDLRLNTALVTLSACETALGTGYFSDVPAGDDFVSLSRAFLDAGSASVLATLWQVDDLSTARLMQDFYRRLARGQKAQSLAAAQRELRREYQHPYYWAPFVLVGKMN